MQHTIDMDSMAFNPSSLIIKQGDSVVWTNKDGMIHTATRTIDPAFDTGPVNGGTSSNPITFDKISDLKGFQYHCRPHPFMLGIIIVNP